MDVKMGGFEKFSDRMNTGIVFAAASALFCSCFSSISFGMGLTITILFGIVGFWFR